MIVSRGLGRNTAQPGLLLVTNGLGRSLVETPPVVARRGVVITRAHLQRMLEARRRLAERLRRQREGLPQLPEDDDEALQLDVQLVAELEAHEAAGPLVLADAPPAVAAPVVDPSAPTARRRPRGARTREALLLARLELGD